jgi:mannose-1-phosphate guanylyltransferase
MKNKQMTAVEWLEKELYEWAGGRFYFPPHFFEEAKEMEKEQIIETWHNGYENQSPMIDEDNCGEQYYNKTYKSE